MKFRQVIVAAVLLNLPVVVWANGSPKAGQDPVMSSCTTCHASLGTNAASDGVPPPSYIAHDQKNHPDWIDAWLLQPHPAMAGIMLSREQKRSQSRKTSAQ